MSPFPHTPKMIELKYRSKMIELKKSFAFFVKIIQNVLKINYGMLMVLLAMMQFVKMDVSEITHEQECGGG